MNFWPRSSHHVARVHVPACVAAFVFVSTLTACATQREQRVSSAEARERPTDEACEGDGKGKGNPPAPGWVWACGYWHWDSVRYVWIDGQWQAP